MNLVKKVKMMTRPKNKRIDPVVDLSRRKHYLIRPQSPKPRTPREEAFERLDSFSDEARSGAGNEFLAQQAQVSLNTVVEWRKDRGIEPIHPRDEGEVQALEVAHDADPRDPLSRAESSVLKGEWNVPTYILRKPLDYDGFCRALHTLWRAGFNPEDLAKSFGVTYQSAEQAIAIYANYIGDDND